MSSEHRIPKTSCRTKMTIKGSRFITTLAHADNPVAAREFIHRIKNEFRDASHNCWAYVAGPPGRPSSLGAGDDGEPRGSAGRPMLNVLVHSGIGEIAAVVTRYFGGVKLGVGGLTRAYRLGVKNGLAELETIPKTETARVEITIAYSAESSARKSAQKLGAVVADARYGEKVTLLFQVDTRRVDELHSLLAVFGQGVSKHRFEAEF